MSEYISNLIYYKDNNTGLYIQISMTLNQNYRCNEKIGILLQHPKSLNGTDNISRELNKLAIKLNVVFVIFNIINIIIPNNLNKNLKISNKVLSIIKKFHKISINLFKVHEYYCSKIIFVCDVNFFYSLFNKTYRDIFLDLIENFYNCISDKSKLYDINLFKPYNNIKQIKCNCFIGLFK